MPARSSPAGRLARQGGAALAVVLTLVAAATMLAAAAMRNATFDTAMTSRIALHAQARLAAISGLQIALADHPLPTAADSHIELALGQRQQFRVDVDIRYLGETTTNGRIRHYELTAQATAARGVQHRRRRYHRQRENEAHEDE